MRLRYGVEPPVLVKLEKEIEMEETLLLTEEPPPAVKTFSVCCQHGGLYQPGVSSVMKQTRYEVFFFTLRQNLWPPLATSLCSEHVSSGL